MGQQLSKRLLKQQKLEISDFTGSSGWIDHFKHRHGIVYQQISGEAESVDKNLLATWTDNILPLQDYTLEEEYNYA